MSRYFGLAVSLLIVLPLVQCGLRFRDEEMLRKHHNEPYPSDGPSITVHLVPHSHDDVGWLKTVDNYFYGGDMKTQFAGVQYTIDTVVSELVQHPEYKFTIVEVAFLYRWWNSATQLQKSQMKTLVASKQIQFINGGWCMSDEANMHYEDFIDQMTVGLRWLKETFNYVPVVAWHIDPFGHHSSSASLFSQMGFQAFFFARIDYQDKEVRLANKAMEMIWRPLQYTQDESTYIFTHVNYYHYSPPPGFCFDARCTDEPIKDDPTLEDYNIVTKSQELVNYFKSQAQHFRTSTIMHTLGEDFHFTNSRMWFKNFDKLLKYINGKPEYGVKIMYSTPNDYIESIQKIGASYPTKNDDFMPYADNQHSFWTGYFVSRVALKGFVRDFSRFVQAVRKHVSELKISNASAVIKNSARSLEDKIFGLEAALGILQHHDAVAGTAKQKVTNDYVSTGLRAISTFNQLYREIKSEEVMSEIGEKVAPQDFYLNVHWNETSKVTGVSSLILANKSVLISYYNPGQKGTFQMKLKVPAHELNVVSVTNTAVPGDVICADLNDVSDCELFFSLNFEEASSNYIKLIPVKTGGSAKVINLKELTLTEQIKDFKLGSDTARITRGSQKFDLVLGGVAESFNILYNYYEGFVGPVQSSGAYIFRPLSDNQKSYSSIKKLYYADGVTTAIVVLEGDRTLTKVIFSKTPDYVKKYGFEVETFIDSIPINDGFGKEVTLNLKTSYGNNKIFYTDSNGLEEQKRVLNFRPTWNYIVHEPTAGNYYPVNSHIRIQDVTSNKSLTVLVDRSQGATVLTDGEIQIMIHRRLLHDDGRGVDEPLNQTDTDGKGLRQYVRHYVNFNGDYRKMQKLIEQKMIVALSPTATSNFAKGSLRKAPISVPASVKFYLRPFEDGSYLARFHNFDTTNSVSFTLDEAWNLKEQTLAANQLQDDWKAKQYKWTEDKKEGKREEKKDESPFTDLEAKVEEISDDRMKASTVSLKPFEMKAFKLTQ